MFFFNYNGLKWEISKHCEKKLKNKKKFQILPCKIFKKLESDNLVQ